MLGDNVYPFDEKRRRWLADRSRPNLARQKAPHITVGGEPHVTRGVDAEAPAPFRAVERRARYRVKPRVGVGKVGLMLGNKGAEHGRQGADVARTGGAY